MGQNEKPHEASNTPAESKSSGVFTKAKRLTVAKVLQTKGFEDYTEEQAERYILDIERLCLWMYEQYCLIKNT